jgi:hypothetical protein
MYSSEEKIQYPTTITGTFSAQDVQTIRGDVLNTHDGYWFIIRTVTYNGRVQYLNEVKKGTLDGIKQGMDWLIQSYRKGLLGGIHNLERVIKWEAAPILDPRFHEWALKILAHAHENYETGGWDSIYECTDVTDILQDIIEEGYGSYEELLQSYSQQASLYDEHRTEVRAEIF